MTWAMSTIGEQFDVQLGKMLDAAKNVGVSKPYLGNRAVQWGRIDASVAGVVPMTRSDIQRYRLREGDLLVCEGGEVGRGAIWRNQLPECYYQKALHRLRAKNGYDARVMLALLQHWSSIGAFSDFVTQTSIAHLPREKFILMPLPLPSEAEQRRIGDALQDADDLIATLERLIEKKQAIKQGMIQALLSGRTRLPGFVEPWLPSVGLTEIATKMAGCWGSEPGTAELDGQVIRAGDVGADNVLRGSVQRGLTMSEAARSRCEVGDVVLTASGTIGNVAFIDRTGLYASNFVRVLRPKRGLLGSYLYYALQSAVARRAMDSHLGVSAMPNLGGGFYREPWLELPSVDEQGAIVEVLTDASRELDRLFARRDKARAIKNGMMQQLLTGRVRLPVEAVS